MRKNTDLEADPSSPNRSSSKPAPIRAKRLRPAPACSANAPTFSFSFIFPSPNLSYTPPGLHRRSWVRLSPPCRPSKNPATRRLNRSNLRNPNVTNDFSISISLLFSYLVNFRHRFLRGIAFFSFTSSTVISIIRIVDIEFV